MKKLPQNEDRNVPRTGSHALAALNLTAPVAGKKHQPEAAGVARSSGGVAAGFQPAAAFARYQRLPVLKTPPGTITLLLLLAVVALASAADTNAPARPATNPAAAPAAAPSRLDYTAFKIVSERNIFNANRSGGRAVRGGPTRRPVRVDSFALRGVQEYEKGSFAFFDGSGSEYRKVLKPEGKIAGYTIKAITLNSVTMEANGKELELRVGTQLRREDGGPWRISSDTSPGTGDSRSSRSGRNSNSTEAGGSNHLESGSASGSDSGPEMNEVLRKLMQQREQESK